jgi:mannose-6-phosphate isomerase-like protein (cupin superfamily)
MVAIMNIRKSAGALLALCAANAFAAEVVDLSGTSQFTLATNSAETCALPVGSGLNGEPKRTELEIHEYSGEGFKRMVKGPKWTVAALNHAEIFDEAHFKRLERHNLTDESFVLLAGEATLLVGEKAERVRMLPLKVYNVPAGVWHHIFVSRDARVLVVENSDTSKANTDYLAVR